MTANEKMKTKEKNVYETLQTAIWSLWLAQLTLLSWANTRKLSLAKLASVVTAPLSLALCLSVCVC